MQPAIAVEPVPKFQPLSKIAKSETLHWLHVPSPFIAPRTVVRGTSRRRAAVIYNVDYAVRRKQFVAYRRQL
jgi:hypothetical protein